MWADNSASVVALVVPHMNLILGFFQRGCLGGGGGSGGVTSVVISLLAISEKRLVRRTLGRTRASSQAAGEGGGGGASESEERGGEVGAVGDSRRVGGGEVAVREYGVARLCFEVHLDFCGREVGSRRASRTLMRRERDSTASTSSTRSAWAVRRAASNGVSSAGEDSGDSPLEVDKGTHLEAGRGMGSSCECSNKSNRPFRLQSLDHSQHSGMLAKHSVNGTVPYRTVLERNVNFFAISECSRMVLQDNVNTYRSKTVPTHAH